MQKVKVTNIGDGTEKELLIGSNGKLIDPDAVEAENAKARVQDNERRLEEATRQAQETELKQAAEIRAQLAHISQRLELTAQLRKATYDAHVKMGFTPEQAMQITLSIK